ncbi:MULTISPECIES: hypothetical protein [unclassified Halomonas]|uniref:hypothetical protein n=1 Tax=unclassified Halomonas TaxID=2609666 RepID=UPI001C950064|nr:MULTISPECIES: hypothetical protein [unclassified Halomonas]MBY5924885.1 hypothetical protein [Halomonas sp. DP4Y7-2]MBY6231927.1 hypothetical protein [Halomonas sp. DP4Y7-1]
MNDLLSNIIEIENMDVFSSSYKGDGRYNIYKHNTKIETLIQNTSLRNPDRIFVLFSGARDPNRHPLPKFDRWKWREKFPGIVVNISDPSLYFNNKRLRIGWYFGDRKNNFSSLIAEVVLELAAFFEVDASNIIFYGSSAGGFAAITISSLIEGATAVAINPQVVLKNYPEAFYNKFLSASLGVESDTELHHDEKERMDAAIQFSTGKNNKCLLVQNIKDYSHLESHYSHFCDVNGGELLGGESENGRIYTWLYSAENGHGPEPMSMVEEIVNKSVEISRTPTKKTLQRAWREENEYSILKKSFFVTKKNVSVASWLKDNYNLEECRGFLFYYSEGLRYYLCKSAEVDLIIIGVATHIDKPEMNESDVADFLQVSWKKGKTQFYEALDFLAGSFVVLVFDSSNISYAFTDACGTYGIFYSDKNSKFCVSSHAYLVSKVIGTITSDFQRYWINHPVFSAGGKYYPGNLTEFNSVFQLTPNTYLSSFERNPIRYFPRNKLVADESVESTLNFIKHAIENQLLNFSSRYKLTMSISGGLDSRVSLSASRRFKDKITYFTYSIRGNRYLKRDLEIARELSNVFGLKHSEIKVKAGDKVSSQLYQQLEINSPGNTANADLIQSYINFFGCDEDRVHIRSNLMEIARGYYLSNIANHKNAYTSRKISSLFRSGSRDELTPVFDSFLRDIQFHKTAGKGYHYSDLFYWEHRMGVFVANVAKRERPIHETVMLFNNRKILNAALSISMEDRVSAKLFYDLVEGFWPETLDVALSSGSKWYTHLRRSVFEN